LGGNGLSVGRAGRDVGGLGGVTVGEGGGGVIEGGEELLVVLVVLILYTVSFNS
jgi:hypothetical protein